MQRAPLEKMLQSGQDSAMLRYTLGLVCFQEADYEAAVTHLRRAIEQDRRHSASWKIYARSLAALQRGDEAREAFATGIEVAESQGDIQAAKEMKVFARRLDPGRQPGH